MQLGSGYTGLSVEDGTSEEISYVARNVHKGAKVRKVFALNSASSGRGLIAAAQLKVYTNTLDIFETNLEGFGVLKYRP
jgi:hypothetical protein